MDRTGNYDRAEGTLREASNVPEAIIEYTVPFDLIVFGAPEQGLLRQFIHGTVPDDVTPRTEGTVLTVHRGGVEGSLRDRWI